MGGARFDRYQLRKTFASTESNPIVQGLLHLDAVVDPHSVHMIGYATSTMIFGGFKLYDPDILDRISSLSNVFVSACAMNYVNQYS